MASLPALRFRRLHLLAALLAACAGLLLLAGAAGADVFTPDSGGSANADAIDSLYTLILWIALVIFIGVEGLLAYSLFRFSAKRSPVAAQIRGNTRLEIGWTVGAALILVVLTVVTFLKLDDIKDPERSGGAIADGALLASTERPRVPGGKGLEILVTGRQYMWRYQHPNGAYAFENLVVPVGTTVILKIQATDVAHSWWIPELGGKMDAVPGYTNWTWFKAKKAGVFTGACAELCGRNHADMRARVTAVDPAEYERYAAELKSDIAAANKSTVQQRDTLDRNTTGGPPESGAPEGGSSAEEQDGTDAGAPADGE